MNARRTLYEKIWDAHVVARREDGACLLYIDRHLIHEVTSPQAFDGLRRKGRAVRRPDLTLAVADHNLPTTERMWDSSGRLLVDDPASAAQLDALESNVADFKIRYFESRAPERYPCSTVARSRIGRRWSPAPRRGKPGRGLATSSAVSEMPREGPRRPHRRLA